MARGFTLAGIGPERAEDIEALLAERLVATIDLQLTLKHIHWNVVGPRFIAVHEMLDEFVDQVTEMSDEIAERIAALGGTPVGTPGHVAAARTWEEYGLGRADTLTHLAALDHVLSGVNTSHRKVMDDLAELDPASQDMIIGQIRALEKMQWFVRAHLEDADGNLTGGA